MKQNKCSIPWMQTNVRLFNRGVFNAKSEYIPAAQLGAIMAHLSAEDRYITALALATGFRIDDLLHVRTWQLRRSELTIKERKTGHVRTVSLPDELIRQTNRHALSYAFPSFHSDAKKLHRSTYWRHFLAAAAEAGYGGRGYSPHSLRKVYAVRLRNAGYSVERIRADLGHCSQATTLIYAFSDLVTGLDSDVCDRFRTDAFWGFGVV